MENHRDTYLSEIEIQIGTHPTLHLLGTQNTSERERHDLLSGSAEMFVKSLEELLSRLPSLARRSKEIKS